MQRRSYSCLVTALLLPGRGASPARGSRPASVLARSSERAVLRDRVCRVERWNAARYGRRSGSLKTSPARRGGPLAGRCTASHWGDSGVLVFSHVEQLPVRDRRPDCWVVGLHVLAPSGDQLFVVVSSDDVAALTHDPLAHRDIVAHMVVQLCGRFLVRSGDRELSSQLPGAQGRIAFAWLVCNRHRDAGRDELAAALWGEEQPP